MKIDGPVAEIVIKGPEGPQPEDGAGFVKAGDQAWVLKAFRELDDALIRLRFEFPGVGLLTLKDARRYRCGPRRRPRPARVAGSLARQRDFSFFMKRVPESGSI